MTRPSRFQPVIAALRATALSVRPRSTLLLLSSLTAACDLLTGDACTRELRVTVEPASVIALQIGQVVSPDITLSSCGGRETLSDTFTWMSSDTTVARVNVATGTITGVAPGMAQVQAAGARYGNVALISVTVQ
jgi:hypothetical protein